MRKPSWKANTAVYGLYVLFVLGTGLYADFFDTYLHRLTGRMWMLAGGVVILSPLLLGRIRAWVPKKRGPGRRLSPWAFRAICMGCSLAVLGFLFLGVNPGGFDGDPGVQLRQALTRQYDDYYPVLHTLLVFRLPLTLTGGWVPSVILGQILLFSLALTFLCDTVRQYGDTRWAFLSLAVILLNPISQSYLLYGYKDETFGICAMVLVCMNARILFSRGEWLKKPLHLAAFAGMLAAASLIRYNGILFALPCLAGAALCVSWKRTAALAGAALLLIAGVRGPLSGALNVKKTEDRSTQTMGLPMAVIGGAVKYRPEKLDQEVLDFAYSVAPKEVWEEKYTWGVYNWVDWNPRSNHQALADAGVVNLLKYTAAAFREAPKECLKALIDTTAIVYGITPDYLADGAVYVSGGDSGLVPMGIPWIENVLNEYRRILYIICPHAFLHSGVTLMLLMTVGLARLPLNRKRSWRRIVPVLSVFCYNLVTMLMLFSWWDGARFFHYSLWVAPVLLLMLVHGDEEEPAGPENAGIRKSARISTAKGGTRGK